MSFPERLSLPLTIIVFCLAAFGGGEAACPEVTLTREVLNDGFHRDLISKMELGAIIEHTADCRVMIKERLPSGLYVDPYQLASMQQHNVTEVLILDSIDVEAPEYLSMEHTLFVYAKPDPKCAGCFSAVVPIHIRYHQPSEEREEALVILPSPQLLVRCKTDLLLEMCHMHLEDAPCSVRDKTACHWTDVTFKPVPEVVLQVPVGLKQHGFMVCTVTILVTLFCSVMIFAAVWKHGQF
ncbi:phosphatidylinositol-glycan biosynthesis class X protein [Rhinatrema bivittatum]|uniref:phosphatidylinositol-glycan biosynthesis class X protein n=1 Tax=Rhinatrema bivittatum TaxID=194408 RepID=UPI00112DEEBF|nr:phosphatidylinositol-glycan biosynthesis class X protein [Rhinatrema bivittatum]